MEQVKMDVKEEENVRYVCKDYRSLELSQELRLTILLGGNDN